MPDKRIAPRKNRAGRRPHFCNFPAPSCNYVAITGRPARAQDATFLRGVRHG